MPRDQRKGIENGIWLCQTCAKLIDSDVSHYTVTLLQEWKRAGEERASEVVGIANQGLLIVPSWLTPTQSTADHDYAPALQRLAEQVSEAERQRLEALLNGAREHLSTGRFSLAYREYNDLAADSVLERLVDLKFKVLNNRALAARHLGLKDEALASAREAVALDPGNEIGRFTYLGTLGAFQEAEWDEQVANDRAWLEQSSTGLQFLGTHAYDHDELDESIALSRRAIEQDSSNDAARINLALSWNKQSKHTEAIQILGDVRADSLLFVTAQVMMAELLYKCAQTDQDPTSVLERASTCLDLAESNVAAKRLEKNDWRDTQLHALVCRASIRMLRGEAREARELLQDIEEEIVDRHNWCFNIGQAFAAEGNWDNSIAALTEAHEIKPEHTETGVWLGVALINRFSVSRDGEDVRKAEGAFRQILEREVNGLALLNMVQICLGTGRLADANRLVQRAKALAAGDLEVMVAELLLLIRQGRPDEAIAKAQEIYKVDPREATAATFLGVRSFRAGRNEEALLQLQNAVSDPFCRSSFHVEAYVFLARTLRRLGLVPDAIERALEGLRRFPGEPDIAMVLEEVSGRQA